MFYSFLFYQPYFYNNLKDEFLANANEYWNKFYSKHENKFFKDRNWLFTEFPELLIEPPKDLSANVKSYILEVGCGVGNTVFPLVRSNKYFNLIIKNFKF